MINFRSLNLAAVCILAGFAPSMTAAASPALQSSTAVPISRVVAQGRTQSTWNKFSPKDGSFSILMPGKPEEEHKSGTSADEPLEDHTFKVETDEGLFIVSYAEFAQELSQANPQNVLDEVTKGFDGGGTKVVSQRNISLNGIPGREVEYTVTEGINARARIFLVKQRLYLLQVVSGKNEHRVRFLDSFQLIKKG